MKNRTKIADQFSLTGTAPRRPAAILLISIFALVAIFTGLANASDRGKAQANAEKIEYQFAESDLAGQPFDPSGGLDAYLAYAALHNQGLHSAFYGWKAQLERSSAATALPNPMLTYGYFIQSVETRVGPQEQKLSFKQSFPWFGTLGLKGDVAFEAANSAYEKFQSEKLKLFYRVKRAYYQYYFLGRQLSVTRDNFELLRFWESVLRTRYQASLEKHPDVIKTQVELGRLEDQIRSLEEKIEPTASQLRAVLDLPDTVGLPVPDSIAFDTTGIPRDSLLTRVRENNPDLMAIRHTIDKEKAGIKLANKSSYPNFSIGVDYIETGPALNPMLPESGKDPWMVSVGIDLPIWFGKNKSRKNEARSRLSAARHNLAQAQNDLTAYTDNVHYDYEDNLRKISLYRDGLLPKAEQSLNTTYASYEAGESDFLSVLDAQRQLLNFQLEYDRAYTNAAVKRAEMEMLAGQEFGRQE